MKPSLTATAAEPRVIGPIEWEGYEGFNPEFTGYTAAPACTGAPEKGWCLYTRGVCWEQRTKTVLPPEQGAEVRRIDGQWMWVQPNPGPAAVRKSLVIALEGKSWAEIEQLLQNCLDHVSDAAFRCEEPEAVRFAGGSGHECFWAGDGSKPSLEMITVNATLRRLIEIDDELRELRAMRDGLAKVSNAACYTQEPFSQTITLKFGSDEAFQRAAEVFNEERARRRAGDV